MSGSWVVIVPVKPPTHGKSRLEVSPDVRRELAEAFALDTVTAARIATSVAVVLVVTDDARFARETARAGCEVLPDGVGDDLNGTLVQAAAEARRRHPGLRVAALCGDLPALRPADLDAALGAVEAGGDEAGFVADADGVGTTLYAGTAERFEPRFGVGSAAAHEAAGAWPVDLEVASLRRDVDTLTDVRTAAALGLGACSAAAVAASGLAGV